jgi:tripartite-type tricarboxylate transporter receptor subunit TctC
MHMGLAQFNSMGGVRIPGVIYKGAGPALTSLLGGETQMAFISMPTVAAHIQAGKLRALAVTGERRSPAAPDLPTAGESGLPGFVFRLVWLSRAGENRRRANRRLNAECAKRSRIRKSAAPAQVRCRCGSEHAREFGTFLCAEIAKWGKVVRRRISAGIARRRLIVSASRPRSIPCSLS